MRCFERLPSGDQDDRYRQFDEIVGDSPALEAVLEQVERVAPTSATVLIQGETGTGKELIAKAIHNISSRYARSYVKLNCAAIPLELLESELFGHEKGAFTGAIAQKIGRFELADKGTLFLDEVGDLPLALQPKLLRVLQEQEFERLGSGVTHRIDVRLVAATHRDLEQMVKRNEFRGDLYYRLNVFPVLLPPLRARREDIPALVTHFVGIYSRQMNKRIDHIPVETMSALTSYAWPGNVREMQNLIQRAVILSSDGVLPNPWSVSDEKPVTVFPSESALRNFQRAVILQALEAAGWVVGGPDGAAARLAMPRNTLVSKMKRLGISRPVPQTAPPSGTFEDSERALILEVLEAGGWVVGGSSGAAARLGLKRTTLASKMRKLGISRPMSQRDLNRTNEEYTDSAVAPTSG